MNLNKFPNYNNQKNTEEEITLKDVLDFYALNWKFISLFCLIGFFLSSIVVLITPSTYTGIALIQLAKTTNPSIYPNGTPLEDPSLLITRIKNEYLSVDSCNQNINGEYFIKLGTTPKIIISPYKLLPNTVMIKVNLNTESEVVACINDLITIIRNSQSDITRLVIQNIKEQIKTEKDLQYFYKNLINNKVKSSLENDILNSPLFVEINRIQNNFFMLNSIINYIESNQPHVLGRIELQSVNYRNHLTIIILGFFISLIIASFIVLLKNYFHKFR